MVPEVVVEAAAHRAAGASAAAGRAAVVASASLGLVSGTSSAAPQGGRSADRHVVILAPSRGDAGNAAVLEALLELSDDAYDIVLADESVPAPSLSRRSTVRTLPALLSGTRSERQAALLRVERLLAGAARCTLIAPDTIVSRDDVHAFVRCVALVRAAAAAGVDTRMIGLTWNLGGGSVGVQALQAAVRSGVVLYARDDFSMMRAMNAGVGALRLAADLALAARASDRSVLTEADVVDGPFALLTVCASVLPGGDPAADYVALAERMLRRGLRVVLQPSAPSGYDLLLLGRVARALPSGTAVLRRTLKASETRALTTAARLVITDRTRTAVLALSGATPVLGLAARRELEGLLRAGSMGDCSLLPKPGFGSPAGDLVDRLLDAEGLSCEARRALDRMASMAMLNLTGLPVHEQRDRAIG